MERDVERLAAFFEAEERLTDAWWRETILLTGGYLHLTALSTGGWQVRLPTEAEWEKAAGWDADMQQKRLYAWGNTWDASKANVDDQVGYPCAVGVFPAGAAACSALDMTGNVWEWTLSQYADYPYKCLVGFCFLASSFWLLWVLKILHFSAGSCALLFRSGNMGVYATAPQAALACVASPRLQ